MEISSPRALPVRVSAVSTAPVEAGAPRLGFSDVDRLEKPRTVGARNVAPAGIKSAVVLGAGPAGLISALELLQNGVQVTLVEKRDAYTRPIHFNIRAALLHRLADTAPEVVPKVLERLGGIERVEIVNTTITSLPADEIERLRRRYEGREVTVGPAGLRTSQPGPPIPTPDAALAGYDPRAMFASHSIGQIWCVDLEEILFAELQRQAAAGAPLRVIRKAESAVAVDRFGNYGVSVNGESLGTPDLVVVAEGANSATREAENIPRTFISDGTTFVAGSIDGSAATDKAPHGGLVRLRYSEVKDPKTGELFGLRQVVVGHAKRAQSWCLTEVPPFIALQGNEAVDRYFRENAALVLERPVADVLKAHVSWGPSAFTMQQHMSKSAVKGNNMIFIGDAVGNAHFLTSGGLMTACVPHTFALEKLLADVAKGTPKREALREYNTLTMDATREWLRVGFAEFGRISVKKNFNEALRAAYERLGLPPPNDLVEPAAA